MRFVPIKTVEQAVLTVHRARELLVSERTAVALAAKHARILWALWAGGQAYQVAA